MTSSVEKTARGKKKVLLSTIGSRGEVQPLLALALALREVGHEANLCAPPNFKNWIESFGVSCFPIGPDLEKLTAAQASGAAPRPSEEQMRQAGIQMVHGQFDVFPEAARGCDLIVGGGALAIATRSVAESLGISYLFVAYCPVTFPTTEYPPLMHPEWLKMTDRAPADHAEQRQGFAVAWKEDEERFNHVFLSVLNERRTKLGLSAVDDVRRHIFTDSPWLCSDPILAPAPSRSDLSVIQTGAWFLRDQSHLPPELESFLASGEPPVYFGFGSMAGSPQTGPQLIEAARACGLRSVISQGWGNLGASAVWADCISIGEINHEELFPRVAAVVHHGGAGTAHAAARAGKPQVIVPHMFDQFYHSLRIQQLGIGVSCPPRHQLTSDVMINALRRCLQPDTKASAQSLGNRVVKDAAIVAARQLSQKLG